MKTAVKWLLGLLGVAVLITIIVVPAVLLTNQRLLRKQHGSNLIIGSGPTDDLEREASIQGYLYLLGFSTTSVKAGVCRSSSGSGTLGLVSECGDEIDGGGQNEAKGTPDSRVTFTLQDYLSDKFQYETYSLQWVSENQYLHTKGRNVFLINANDGTETKIIADGTLANYNSSEAIVSPDQKYALLRYRYEKVWRHSYNASYHLYNIVNNSLITANPLPQDIQYISWSPVGHKLAFVWHNNIYVKETPDSPHINITTNGEENKIFNGLADWVYEEEMFGTHSALWWSPNGRFLAYAEINDTDVPVIEYSFYSEDTLQYPRTIRIPYPKGTQTILGSHNIETNLVCTALITLQQHLVKSSQYNNKCRTPECPVCAEGWKTSGGPSDVLVRQFGGAVNGCQSRDYKNDL
ncbi:Dipeptidyl peptidase 4 [Varanus komodoensis]|nr:Dipeptidyl peptidase 4 [Varanus komodoensis]